MKPLKITLLLFLLCGVAAYSQSKTSSDWTAFIQTLKVESKTTKKFKLEASVKLVTDDEHAWAGLWARVDNKEGSGFFDNMGDRPVKSKEWQTYTIEGTLDSNSKTLNFGGLCLFNGRFYFDNFKLFIENDKGILKQVDIQNNGFELKQKNGQIPGWGWGISQGKVVQVLEYEARSTDDKTDGKLALLIEGKGIKYEEFGNIGGIEGASPQIGAMISMLEDLKNRVERKVKGMTQYELDYLHDENANRIGSLIMHLAAAEYYYQVLTFENRELNDEEKKKWGDALDLDKGGRDTYQGHDAQYYLDAYNEVRAKTISELKKRNDEWFKQKAPNSEITNHWCWFHVMEHQSSHLGQILFLAKRIPPAPETNMVLPMKN